MGERKQPGRFTIQFSQQDPQQRIVTEILEGKGRRKAQFITSAVLQYSQSAASCDAPRPIPRLDEEHLEQMILSVVKRLFQSAASATESPNMPKAPEEESETSLAPWDDVGDDSALAAISNTLAAFRQK